MQLKNVSACFRVFHCAQHTVLHTIHVWISPRHIMRVFQNSQHPRFVCVCLCCHFCLFIKLIIHLFLIILFRHVMVGAYLYSLYLYFYICYIIDIYIYFLLLFIKLALTHFPTLQCVSVGFCVKLSTFYWHMLCIF